jgi:hypothetical protein
MSLTFSTMLELVTGVDPVQRPSASRNIKWKPDTRTGVK